MEVDLLDFVRECRRLAKQTLGTKAAKPDSGGFARWKHVVLHCIRIEDDYTYRELIDRLLLMDAICDVLVLDPDEFVSSIPSFQMTALGTDTQRQYLSK